MVRVLMCGRAYQTYTQEELALRYLNEKPLDLPNFSPNFNLCPTQLCPIVVDDQEGNKQLKLFRWGLIPHWSKDKKSAFKMINARSETVTEKPSFRNAVRHRRCIVPLSGFYEWKRDGDVKRPFAISLKDQAVMSVAGIWETWISPPVEESSKEELQGEKIFSFSILTTEANSAMQSIHDRMPVILNPETEERWLDPKLTDPLLLKDFFKPCPSDWLQAYEIAPLINNPRNNTQELLKPLSTGET
ncbi:MAG: SOS response-associated peptidase [Bdellovibrionia bacterium]